MKKIIMLLLIAITVIGIQSCKESTDPSNDPTINLYSAMDNEDITMAIKENTTFTEPAIDSIVVTRYRALISRVKLHTSEDDDGESENDDDKNMIADGPLVLTGDYQGNEYKITTTTVPADIYKRIKLEFHRFTSEELTNYANDEIFGDFATPERYTFIVEGFIYENGEVNGIPFTFNSEVVLNFNVNFDPVITLEEDSDNDLYLVFDPMRLFENGQLIYDPRDPKNENDIEKAIKDAMKAFKKN